ncbi:MAG: hypothetical protein V2A58_14480 [Planctomycetota bacterium]
MAKVKVLAGDFLPGDGQLVLGDVLVLRTKNHMWLGENIPISQLEKVEEMREETVKGMGGSLAKGVLGGALFGLAGVAAGALSGGQKTIVTFAATFKDGRRLLATTDSQTFSKLQAATFK